MLTYRHVTTLHKGSGRWQANISDLELAVINGVPTLAAASELVGEGVTLYKVPFADKAIVQGSSRRYLTDFTYQQSPDVAFLQTGTGSYLHFSHVGGAGSLGLDILSNGTLGEFRQILPKGASSADLSSLGQLELDGGDFLYASRLNGLSLSVFGSLNKGTAKLVNEYSFDWAGLHEHSSLDKVIDADVGNAHFLIAVSGLGDFISTHRITDSGQVLDTTLHSTRLGSGISVPTDLSALSYAGKTLIVVAAPGSSSLTVLQLRANGQLVPLDHVIDEGFTSFQGVSVFETVSYQGRPFIFAGGSDGGITVFTVLPDGKLVHLQTIADEFDMTLADVSDIEATVIGGDIAVFASSTSEVGITQLVFNPGKIGNTGTAQGRILNGGDHNDILLSRSATPHLRGGDGDDILVARRGSVTLTGGAGNDIFIPRKVNGTISIKDFELGKDQLDLSQLGSIRSHYQLDFRGNDNRMRILAGDTVLVIHSSHGRALVEADFRNDMFPVAHYALPEIVRDSVVPDTGVPDTGGHIFGTDTADLLQGGAGPDFLIASGGDDTVNAGQGNDNVHGQSGDDRLYGGVGHDLLTGSDGNDRIGGGFGDDQIFGDDGQDTVHGGQGNDHLEGGGKQDLLLGHPGHDTLKGGSGDDRLAGGYGNDSILGNLGNDTLQGNFGGDWLNGGIGRDNLAGGVGNDTIFGGHDADMIDGQGGRDRLFAGAGNDIVMGNSGDDYLFGGAGDDRLFGYVGRDRLVGYAGSDLLFGGYANDTLFGGEGKDTLFGGAMNDVISGDSGADHLVGGGGRDRLFAGAGNDTVMGNSGDDVLFGGAGGDRLFGDAGRDRLVGYTGSDRLFGGYANDTLIGGAGHDTLSGGTGQDRLVGGPGQDVFVFTNRLSSWGFAPDRIVDFDRSRDLIDLTELNLSYTGNNAFSANRQLRWDHQAHDTHILADLNGDGRADFKIILSGRQDLAADDFLF